MKVWARLSAVWMFLVLPLGAAFAQTGAVSVEPRVIADGFDQPLFLTAPPGDPRLFVVEQVGRIRIVADGAVAEQAFLDLRDQVRSGGERGLLGLAFHPDYAANGRFFVNYTDRNGDTKIVAYQVSADPDAADPASATTLLAVDQPAANHNGGWLGFGPDGYLYIAMGDGGGAGDRFGNGQNPDSLLGKILRVDVDAGSPYAIPRGNPFASGGGAPEVFVLGVRNPWRPAFDGEDLYIADVGQNQWEEISVITTGDAGANLGWNVMEGSECFRESSCDQADLVLPIHAYSHELGCSITGGYVYRGSAIPEFAGSYFFGDYCSGRVYSFTYSGGRARDLVDWSEKWGRVGDITSFGVDSDGELYATVAAGRLLKFVRSE